MVPLPSKDTEQMVFFTSLGLGFVWSSRTSVGTAAEKIVRKCMVNVSSLRNKINGCFTWTWWFPCSESRFLRHVIFLGVLVTNVEIHCIFVQLQNSLDLYFHEVGKLSTMKWHSVWDTNIHGSVSKKWNILLMEEILHHLGSIKPCK